MTAPVKYQPMGNNVGGVVKSQQTTIEQSRAVAEVQAQVIVAQNCPRDINRAMAEMRESCGLLPMAKQAFYQVPNRGNGPSVHLLRELARIWGNVQHGTHELSRDDAKGESEIQAWAWDVQTNTRTTRTFVVPHARMKAKERQHLTDLGDIQNNNNNVGARAVRECISNVLPRWFTEEAQNLCRATLEHGEGKPLTERVAEMVKVFKDLGISQVQLETKLGKKRGQWDAGDVAQAGIAFTSITRDGYDRDEMFPPVGATVESISGSAPKTGPGRGGGNDLGDGAEPSSGTAVADPPGDQDPPVEVRMASKPQLAKLSQIRAAERYDADADWHGFLTDFVGKPIANDNDITYDDAARVLAEFNEGAKA